MKLNKHQHFLPHMSIYKHVMMDSSSLSCTSIPARPLPWLTTKAALFVSPLYFLVEAYLIQHPLIEGFGRCTSVIPRLPLCLATEVALYSYPLCPLVE